MPWALVGFSGYLTADELYDGPFCVLSLVDNRTFKRLDYQVLDHDATQADVLAFFQRFQARLAARQLQVQAITTDGSALYPPAIAAVFGEIPHPVCQFHVLADLSEAVLHAVAHVRRPWPRRSPSAGAGARPRPSGPKCARRSACKPRSPTCSPTATCSCSGT